MTVFQQTVEAVKQAYPKFSPACLSLSCRTRETGVTMTAKAMKLADGKDQLPMQDVFNTSSMRQGRNGKEGTDTAGAFGGSAPPMGRRKPLPRVRDGRTVRGGKR